MPDTEPKATVPSHDDLFRKAGEHFVQGVSAFFTGLATLAGSAAQAAADSLNKVAEPPSDKAE